MIVTPPPFAEKGCTYLFLTAPSLRVNITTHTHTHRVGGKVRLCERATPNPKCTLSPRARPGVPAPGPPHNPRGLNWHICSFCMDYVYFCLDRALLKMLLCYCGYAMGRDSTPSFAGAPSLAGRGGSYGVTIAKLRCVSRCLR